MKFFRHRSATRRSRCLVLTRRSNDLRHGLAPSQRAVAPHNWLSAYCILLERSLRVTSRPSCPSWYQGFPDPEDEMGRVHVRHSHRVPPGPDPRSRAGGLHTSTGAGGTTMTSDLRCTWRQYERPESITCARDATDVKRSHREQTPQQIVHVL